MARAVRNHSVNPASECEADGAKSSNQAKAKALMPANRGCIIVVADHPNHLTRRAVPGSCKKT
jgi:hypothetical protein